MPLLFIFQGFWDPLNLAEQNFWEQGNEATVGFLRHAEIKHGRVAMAAFVGYIVQANKICFPWALTGGPLAHQGPFADVPGETIMFSDIAAAGSPMDQWDALPSSAKCQILGTIFILEWIGEANMGAHYMRGGKPGFYPSLKEASSENGGIVPHPIPFDLFNPFGLLPEQTEAQKERGRNVEINNGRAAMLGIFGFISASKGLIVPGLDGIEGVGRYSGVCTRPPSECRHSPKPIPPPSQSHPPPICLYPWHTPLLTARPLASSRRHGPLLDG